MTTTEELPTKIDERWRQWDRERYGRLSGSLFEHYVHRMMTDYHSASELTGHGRVKKLLNCLEDAGRASAVALEVCCHGPWNFVNAICFLLKEEIVEALDTVDREHAEELSKTKEETIGSA